MNVAETILCQLGGGRFVAMTGAYNLCSHEDTLSMSLPRNKSRANQLHIQYTPNDFYTMKFIYYRPPRLVKKSLILLPEELAYIAVYEGLYCDQLCDLFTEVTGLYTSL